MSSQASLTDRFHKWLGLMSTVKLAVRRLGVNLAAGRLPSPEYLGNLERSLQMLDGEAAALFREQEAALKRGALKLEEAAQKLNAVADRFDAKPFFPEAVYQPESDRGFLKDMATPIGGNVVLFTGVRRSRQDDGGGAA